MEKEELVLQIQAGAIEKMSLLYEQNRGLLYAVARRYLAMESIEDLMQQAYLGLYEAVQHFKPEEGAKFSTYAIYWIRQSIRRYLDHCGRVLRIPVQEQALYYQYGRFCEYIEKTEGRSPTDPEILRYLHISERRLQSIRMHTQEVVSLDAPLYEEEFSLQDRLADPTSFYERIEERLTWQEHHNTIQDQLNQLEPIEQAVIQSRLLKGQTLAKTAFRLKMKASQVRHIQERAARRLRNNREIQRCAKERGLLPWWI